MAHEQTFVMVKPDGVQRGLSGELISRLERKGLQLVALKMIRIDKDLASQHYAEHQGKPFYPGLVDFITSAPVIAGVWQGDNAISIVRKVLGATSPDKAEPGSIRGDFAINTGFNLMHASDGTDSAQREINLYFTNDEIQHYPLTINRWLYEDYDG
ncbi:MAG: nucleoside-diphosphate kinase [bacterium]|nr:nucleoside-diphosphate kinase [bacterium]